MLFALLATSFSALIRPYEEKSFVSWMRNSNQYYTGEEYHLRLGIYLANARLVQEHNQQAGKTFTLSLNKFATITPAEYRTLLSLKEVSTITETRTKQTIPNRYNKAAKSNAPDSIDWRESGYVCEVQDQASCGSCWAFSAIASAEGAWAKAGNKLIKLSEQNLVDCVSTCAGCNGGLRDEAYNWVIAHQKGQFMLEEDYPYTARDGNCQFDQTKGVALVVGYASYKDGVDDSLVEGVAKYGPTGVGIDAGSFSFQLYTTGIYDDQYCSPFGINHGVCAVGYGSENGTAFWIVRNSWGASWGEQGYIRMIRGKNLCGIASRAYAAYSTK